MGTLTGLKGLYSALLAPYGHPYRDQQMVKVERTTTDEMEEALIDSLRTSQTRVYFVDEFQHVKGRLMRSLLNQLKRTMLVSGVPFVPVGQPETENILKLDLQLADRCPIRWYSHLKFLEFKQDPKTGKKGRCLFVWELILK